MFKSLFVLIVALLSLALVTLAVSQPWIRQSESRELSWPPRLIFQPDARNLDAYHRDEQTRVDTNTGLAIYQHSERTLADPVAGLKIYQESEHTYVDPQDGMTIYHQSERTRNPVRFNPYQLSEWFGE